MTSLSIAFIQDTYLTKKTLKLAITMYLNRCISTADIALSVTYYMYTILSHFICNKSKNINFEEKPMKTPSNTISLKFS